MKLILLRHGKTAANEHHLYCGSTDLPLSEIGRLELDEYSHQLNYPDITNFRIITSGMRRCEETLSAIYGNIAHESDTRFREMAFGVFEGYSYDELKSDDRYIAWITGDNEANITPNGESGEIMTARVLASLRQLISDNRDTLLVTHGGPIAAIMSSIFPEMEKNRYEWQPKPGRGYIVDLQCHMYDEF